MQILQSIVYGLVFIGGVVIFLKLFSHKKEKKGRKLSLLKIAAIAAVITTALAVVMAFSFFMSWHNLTKTEVAGEIHCYQTEKPDSFLVYLIKPGKDLKCGIKGDYVEIEIEVIKFDPILNFLGLYTIYRWSRIRGRYLNVEKEKEPHPVYDLADQSSELWMWLMKTMGKYFFFIDSVYGNSAFQNLEHLASYQIEVSTSGLELHKIKKERG